MPSYFIKTIFLSFILNICTLAEAKLYFFHIQKTAGTTLRLLLEMQVAQDEIYPYRNRLQAKDPMKEHLISGHFPYWLCKTLDPHFEQAFKITILRDPVERYLSYLRARKKRDSFPTLDSVMILRNSNKKTDCLNLRDNAFCRDLADSPFLEGEALLNSAMQTLQKLDYVIFFDHFAEDVSDLFSRLGIRLDVTDIPMMNSTVKEPISEKLVEQIRALNELDIRLYAYAKTQLAKKTTQCRFRTETFDRLLIQTSEIDYTFDLPLNGKLWSYREQMKNGEKYSAYRWVMNHPASIFFPLEKRSDYALYFTAQSLTADIVPRVNVNGKEIEIKKLNSELFSLYHGTITSDLIINDLTEISFYSSKSYFYSDIYPKFTHKKDPPFSFAVNRIIINQQKQ